VQPCLGYSSGCSRHRTQTWQERCRRIHVHRSGRLGSGAGIVCYFRQVTKNGGLCGGFGCSCLSSTMWSGDALWTGDHPTTDAVSHSMTGSSLTKNWLTYGGGDVRKCYCTFPCCRGHSQCQYSLCQYLHAYSVHHVLHDQSYPFSRRCRAVAAVTTWSRGDDRERPDVRRHRCHVTTAVNPA